METAQSQSDVTGLGKKEAPPKKRLLRKKPAQYETVGDGKFTLQLTL